MAIILIPPIILVFVGTFGAAVAGSTMADVKKIGGWMKQGFMPAAVPPAAEKIQVLVTLAEKARKEGLLALEGPIKDIEDPFLQRGLQMAVDGTDPEDLRTVLEAEIAAKKGEDKTAAKFFTAMGGYAPTIGIIGTVIGLIHVLENLNQPDKLGHLIAGRVRRHPVGRAVGQHLLAAGRRQDHPDQRPAGRPDEAARRGHLRDPGRHQPAHRPAEAHLARAAQRGGRHGQGRRMSGHDTGRKGRRRHEEHEEEEHENHERWLVSFADMMTLLTAVFIVLYSISQVDQLKFAAFAEGLSTSFGAPTSIIDDGSVTAQASVLDELNSPMQIDNRTDPTQTVPRRDPGRGRRRRGGRAVGADPGRGAGPVRRSWPPPRPRSPPR